MKKAETRRCYDALIIFELYLHNKSCVRLQNYTYYIDYGKHKGD